MLIHIISLGKSKTNYKFVKYMFLNICFKTCFQLENKFKAPENYFFISH